MTDEELLPMTGWQSDELARIGATDEIRIASLREDGTVRPYRIIWGVRLADDFYVRSVNGTTATWFRGTRSRHEGRIQADGVDTSVSFEDIDDEALKDRIDAAYRQKYRRYPSAVDAITSDDARAATMKVVPRA